MLVPPENGILPVAGEGSGSGIVQFGDERRPVAIADIAARKQDLAVHDQGRRGPGVICGRVSRSGERAGRGVVEFGPTGVRSSRRITSGDQHLAVREQGRRINACKVPVARGGKRPCLGIVKLCGSRSGGIHGVGASANRRAKPCHSAAAWRWPGPGRGHFPGGTEGARSGIIDFGAGEGGGPCRVLPAIKTLPSGSNVAVCLPRGVVMLPVGVNVPLRGSYSSALDWFCGQIASFPPAIRLCRRRAGWPCADGGA